MTRDIPHTWTNLSTGWQPAKGGPAPRVLYRLLRLKMRTRDTTRLIVCAVYPFTLDAFLALFFSSSHGSLFLSGFPPCPATRSCHSFFPVRLSVLSAFRLWFSRDVPRLRCTLAHARIGCFRMIIADPTTLRNREHRGTNRERPSRRQKG